MSVLCKKQDSVAVVVLNRPEALNSIDMEMRAELAGTLKSVKEDNGVRAVVITGAGRAFCAGGDVRSQGQMNISEYNNRMEGAYECIRHILHMPKPVIAAVNGPAAGIGCSVAFAADIIYASENAKFSLAFNRVGLVPDGGCIYLLASMVGMHLAKELVFTGRVLSAGEAAEIKLINRVFPPEDLEPAVMGLATELAGGPTMAYGLAKKLFHQAPYVDFETFLKAESYAQVLAVNSADHLEGRAAFLEKRKPNFTGR